jgi:hypothetical protein
MLHSPSFKARRRLWIIVPCVLVAVAHAQPLDTLDICTEVVTSINHPAQYVQEKLQRGCNLFAPHCCGPSWPTHPECYIINNKKISDAWTELKKITKCDKKTLEVGYREFLNRELDPRMHLGPVKLLMTLIEIQVATQMRDAKPLPSDIVPQLATFRTKLSRAPYDERDIAAARFVPYTGLTKNLLSPKTYNQQQDSMVWGNLIVAGPGLLSATGCERFGMWAHELVHVRQYREAGFYTYQMDYLTDPADYREKEAEREAYLVQDAAESTCLFRPYDIDPSVPGPVWGTVQERVEGRLVPQPNVGVRIEGDGEPVMLGHYEGCLTTTDEDGEFQCEDVPPGRRVVRATKVPFSRSGVEQTGSVTITLPAQRSVAITLDPPLIDWFVIER